MKKFQPTISKIRQESKTVPNVTLVSNEIYYCLTKMKQPHSKRFEVSKAIQIAFNTILNKEKRRNLAISSLLCYFHSGIS